MAQLAPRSALRRFDRAFRGYAPAVAPLRLPAHRFVLYTRGRTGSELLIDLIRSHSRMACDGEILGAPVASPKLWIRGHAGAAARKGSTGYGFKILYTDLTEKQGIKDPRHFLEGLIDDGYVLVTLERRNLLRQAVSWIQATDQQTHYRSEAERSRYRPVTVEPEAAVAVMFMAEAVKKEAAEVTSGLPHVSVIYEDDLEDASTHQATADRVFSALGIPSEPAASSLVRSSARRLSEAIANYDELVDVLSRTRYAEYLDSGATRSA
jgi:LPS sulfotransferase NodH